VQDLIERLEALLAAGDLDQALALVRSYEATDPARYELGMAALAVHQKDVAATTRHAERALALAPDDPMVQQYMAMAALLRGDHAGADRHAQAAVAHGGGLRSLGWLGHIQLGSGNARGAEQTFRSMLALDPGNLQALNGLGASRFQQRDLDEAVKSFARAFDQEPTDPAPIRNLLGVYGDAGRMLGAIALAKLTRNRHQDPETEVAIDLMVLQATYAMLDGYPPPGVVREADDAVLSVLRSSERSPVRIRLGVARALLDCRRFEEAQRLVRDVQPQAVSPVDRGNAEYVCGLLAEQAGDQAAALTAYEASVAADPQRWDACCNAVTLLLERDDPESRARAGQLLGQMSPELKHSRPQLLFNEAVYLRRTGQIAGARAAAQRVRSAAPNTELGELSQKLLEEISDEQ
jgi:tetratricopeptide (TPR) repeat protein